MKTLVTDFFGMQVYTDKGILVGDVDDAVLNIDTKRVDAIAVGNLNPEILELRGYSGIRIPHRLIHNVGDIIIIRHIASLFQKRVKEEE